MKVRSLISILLVLIFSNSFAQRKSWTDTTYFADGKTESVTYWKNNARTSIAYWLKGKDFKYQEFVFGEKDNEGVWVYYLPDGTKRSEYTTVDNIREGPASTFYDGKKYSDLNFHKGIQTGKSVIYYKSGKVKIESEYKKGKRDGLLIVFHENGKKQWTGAYVKGKMSGKRMCYDDQGKPMNGLFVSYQDNGKKEREVKCVNRRPDGELLIYDYNEKVILKGSFKRGSPEGSFYIYNKEGKLVSTDLYEKGEFIKEVIEPAVKTDEEEKEEKGN